MNYTCPQCRKPLMLHQIEIFEKNWAFSNTTKHFSLEQNEIKTPLTCRHCGLVFNLDHLWKCGMFYHDQKYSMGFGTNFHKVYKEKPSIYHAFSCAEDKEGVILEKIKNIAKKGVLLDIACGTGKYLSLLAPYFNKAYGLDASSALLKFARKNNKNISNVEYLLSRAEKIPLLDESVDTILTTWGSFSSNEAFFEMKRVLKKGGVIIRVGTSSIDDLTGLFPNFNEQYIRSNNKYVTELGFSTERLVITVSLASIDEAKSILSQITGSAPSKIKKKELQHEIVFQVFKK